MARKRKRKSNDAGRSSLRRTLRSFSTSMAKRPFWFGCSRYCGGSAARAPHLQCSMMNRDKGDYDRHRAGPSQRTHKAAAKQRLPKRLRIGFRSTGWSHLPKSPNRSESACGTMFLKMPLSAGERIVFYEILGPLGAGAASRDPAPAKSA